MHTTNKNIKIRNASTLNESEVTLRAIFLFVSNDSDGERFYEIPHSDIGMSAVLVYETKRLIVGNYEGIARS